MDNVEYNDNVFSLTIDYSKNLDNPSELFSSISNMIDALKLVDETLISSFDMSYETSFVLNNIESGSIKVFILQVIKNIPDSAIEELNHKRIIGSFLVKGKKKLVEAMEKNYILERKDAIEEIKTELYEEAKNTNTSVINNYNFIDNSKIILNINNISNSIKQLPEKSNMYYGTIDPISGKEYKQLINKNFNIAEDLMDLVEGGHAIDNINTMIIKIKQPDYVSNAMWAFRYDSSPISAKFEDKEWLYKFQNRKVDVRPKDSLKVTMKITNYFDENNIIFATKYVILKVLDVIHYKQADQITMDEI